MSYSYFIFTMIYILFFTMIYILLASLAQGAWHDRWRYGGREEGGRVARWIRAVCTVPPATGTTWWTTGKVFITVNTWLGLTATATSTLQCHLSQHVLALEKADTEVPAWSSKCGCEYFNNLWCLRKLNIGLQAHSSTGPLTTDHGKTFVYPFSIILIYYC